MDDLKRGDVITFTSSLSGEIHRQEVLARLEDLVWTHTLYDSGSVSPVSDVQEIQDLIAHGWTKESK